MNNSYQFWNRNIKTKEQKKSKVPVSIAYYKRPNGQVRHIDSHNVYEDDANFILENNIQISIENDPVSNGIIMYFDDGKMLEDGVTPDEIILLNLGQKKSCEDCIMEGIEKIKARQNS